jgi:hypothetical protein
VILGALPSEQTPHLYRASLRWTVFSILGSGAAIAVFLYLATLIGAPGGAPTSALVKAVWRCLRLAGVVYFLFDVVDTLRFRVILSRDWIEVRRGWGTHRLMLSDIAGWKESPRPYSISFRRGVLCPHKGAKSRRLTIPLVFEVNEAFTTFLNSIPHL